MADEKKIPGPWTPPGTQRNKLGKGATPGDRLLRRLKGTEFRYDPEIGRPVFKGPWKPAFLKWNKQEYIPIHKPKTHWKYHPPKQDPAGEGQRMARNTKSKSRKGKGKG